MSHSANLLPALAKAQAAYPKLKKDASGHFGTYTTMAAIVAAVTPANEVNGLMLIHTLGVELIGRPSSAAPAGCLHPTCPAGSRW